MDIENTTYSGIGKPDDTNENKLLGKCPSCGNDLYNGDLWYKDVNDEYYCDFICYGDVEVKRGNLIDSEKL